ncbi:hypothetical protein, partial [Litorisediminicola beolgyonensis]
RLDISPLCFRAVNHALRLRSMGPEPRAYLSIIETKGKRVTIKGKPLVELSLKLRNLGQSPARHGKVTIARFAMTLLEKKLPPNELKEVWRKNKDSYAQFFQIAASQETSVPVTVKNNLAVTARRECDETGIHAYYAIIEWYDIFGDRNSEVFTLFSEGNYAEDEVFDLSHQIFFGVTKGAAY